MATTDDSGRVRLSVEEALARLPEGDTIHTFVQSGNMLIGADWPRDKVVEVVTTAGGADETGATAQAMGHGLAVERPEDKSPLFIEATGPIEYVGRIELDDRSEVG